VATPWTKQEVQAAVQDYFDMLLNEMRGESHVKAEHNRKLLPGDIQAHCKPESRVFRNSFGGAA